MSVFAHHPLRHTGTRSHSTLQSAYALLIGFVRRIADSPLEQPVLHALEAPARRSAAGAARWRPHAHWHVTGGPDGGRHLEATWHARH
ncbi:hypothetical protein [Streptomyces roseochromogenus]|uniref:Uncharacterized protein n=1 Tax=Streptomyces roseochromogenus subsp. oscitans DS 12.976 TaxID=1352936 RepID=V6JGZ1_STRRC|nr:hypothetical protein [Streptomyces roseochromogenus]EST19125.1 hypothetical protein M878_43445 [Streptomyces roseochromogenus subsp. oscitans DS 12.976]